MRVGVTIQGKRRVTARFNRLRRNAGNLEPAYRRIERRWYAWQEELFRTEGAAGGSRWAALEDRYAAEKARRFGDRGILVRTGALLESLTGGAGSTREVTPEGLQLGSVLRTGTGRLLWRLHHEGAPRANLPKRRIIVVTRKFRFQALRDIAEAVAET